MVSLIDFITAQVADYVKDNTGTVAAVGVAALVLLDRVSGGLVRDTLYKAYDFLVVWLSKAYDIVVDALTFFVSVISLVTGVFPFDNPKKTLMLSVVFFLIVLCIVFVFSAQAWSKGGITSMERKDFSIGDFSGLSELGTTGEGGVSSTITTTTLSGGGTLDPNLCYSDNDCYTLYESRPLKCCTPAVYGNYSCGGFCLKDESYTLDYCRLPNACYNTFDENDMLYRILSDKTSCVGKNPTADGFCRSFISGAAYCCNQNTDVCYGYCTTNGVCGAAASCYHEHDTRINV